jgi:hypothetical protein
VLALQITRTTPLRRTILQFSQILLTLALTFMTASPALATPKMRRTVICSQKTSQLQL